MARRCTLQRELVLETVLKLHTHSTADAVYAELAREHPSVSRGTVYRNLNILAEEGKILRVRIPGEADRFDFSPTAHHHFICLRCRRVFDVDMEPLENPQKRVRDTHGMEFLGWELSFTGLCAECKGKTFPETVKA